MKLFKLLPLAAIGCLMVSCQNGGSQLSESSTPTDSLMYYLGQLNAADYMREAERDTTMKEASARQAYLDGLRAGLNMLKEGDDQYNRGLMQGIQMANSIVNFSEQMDVKIDKNVYAGSLASALSADSMPDMMLAQNEMRRIQTNIENIKKEKDQAAARETLGQEAQKSGLPKISDDLFGKVTQKTDGAQLKDGEDVDTDIKLTKADGSPLNLPLQSKGQIGNNRAFPEVISKAMTSLKSGETGEFLTTAHALTNGRAMQMGLEPNDVIKMTIKATSAPVEEKKEEPAKK